MTLIVCLKAAESVVMAADSRSTKSILGQDSRELLSDETIKVHKVTGSHKYLTAICGTAQINKEPWCLAPLLCTTLLQSFWHRWSHI